MTEKAEKARAAAVGAGVGALTGGLHGVTDGGGGLPRTLTSAGAAALIGAIAGYNADKMKRPSEKTAFWHGFAKQASRNPIS